MDPTSKKMHEAYQVCSPKVKEECTGDCGWDNDQGGCSASLEALKKLLPDDFCTDEKAQSCTTDCGNCDPDKKNCPDSCNNCEIYGICQLILMDPTVSKIYEAHQVCSPKNKEDCTGDCGWGDDEGECSMSIEKMLSITPDDFCTGEKAQSCTTNCGNCDQDEKNCPDSCNNCEVYWVCSFVAMDPTAKIMYQAHQVCSAKAKGEACSGDCGWDNEEDECSVSPQGLKKLMPADFCTDEKAQKCFADCGVCAQDEKNCPDSCEKCAHYQVCLVSGQVSIPGGTQVSVPGGTVAVCPCEEKGAKCEDIVSDARWPTDTAWTVETVKANACAKAVGLCYCTSQSNAACKTAFDAAFSPVGGTPVDATPACAAAGSPVHITVQKKKESLQTFIAARDIACKAATSAAACTEAEAAVATANKAVEAANQAVEDMESGEDSAVGATASLVAVTAAALAAIL
jgi:hypothetical protein